jgi:hypothetical protein
VAAGLAKHHGRLQSLGVFHQQDWPLAWQATNAATYTVQHARNEGLAGLYGSLSLKNQVGHRHKLLGQIGCS